MSRNEDMLSVAKSCIATAKAKGASGVSARGYRVRDVSLDWRDGKVEKITEATTRGIVLQLYVDGRYSSASTSDLRGDALKQFIADQISLTKTLAPDPFRALPEPDLYEGQANVDLQIEDPNYANVSADQGRKLAKVIEQAARSVRGAESILSVTSSFSTALNENWLVTSNGFSGATRGTAFWMGASVSVKDSDGRRPEDWNYVGARHFGELPGAEAVGAKAALRALGRLGSKKGESAAMTVAIDNRAAGRMISFLTQPLSGGALQQKRSFFEGKLGQQVASEILTITDDPLVPKGFGSRRFDMEGIAAKRRPIVENGVLQTFFIDTYYGRKLKMKPTSGSPSNGIFKLGSKSQRELLAGMKEGILITSFLGGNSNAGTGDFSLGVAGFRIRGGEIAEPVAEMNISGNHLEFWKTLVALGNDPYPYSSLKTPTLVFEGVAVAGA